MVDPIHQRDREYPNQLTAAERDRIESAIRAGRENGWSVEHTFHHHLDRGIMLASSRTWHRIAADLAVAPRVTRSRRDRVMPVVTATAPGQAWSWDITDLKSPFARVAFKQYVITDIYSRFRIASAVEHTENTSAAVNLFTAAIAEHGAPRVVHSDNGPTMRSDALNTLFANHGIDVSNSRPYVSNDNPFSEASFSAMKRHPFYPKFFESLESAQAFDTEYTNWHNASHYHSGIAHFTPQQVHDGTWRQVWRDRNTSMQRYYEAHPERFRARPRTPRPAATVGINHLVKTA